MLWKYNPKPPVWVESAKGLPSSLSCICEMLSCSVFHKQRYGVGEGAHRACTPCYKVKYCITVKNMGVSPQKRWEGWKCKEFTLEFIMHLLVRGLAFRK